MFKYLALTAIAAGVLGAAPSAALTTFAAFSPTSSDTNISYRNGSLFTNENDGSAAEGVNVLFSFLIGNNPSYQGISATFTSASVVPNTMLPASGNFDLPGATGSFSFLSNNAITVGDVMLAAGTNLLSGVYTNGFLSGAVTGTAGNLQASTGAGSVISFTSELLMFAPQSEYDFSIGLTAASPAFGPAGGSLANFDASAGGLFSAEPVPTIGIDPDVSAVPEPASWAMLVIGFGVVGFSARRRRNVVVA